MGLFLLFSQFSALAGAMPPGQISLTQTGFVSEDYAKTERKDFQFVGVGLDTLQHVEKESEIQDSFQIQMQGMVAPGASVLSYLNVSQLYWKQGALTLGRKKVSWSLLDEDFVLGLYQPLLKWNSLNPETQGLTGVFLNLASTESSNPWGITFFGSGLFIPDQGAGYDIKNGQFEKINPYFRSVPTQARMEGQTADINYQIQNPDTRSIVFNQSFVGRAYLGDEKKGFFAQAALAHKPSNQLALGIDGVLQINSAVTDNAIETKIFPKISYHNLSSADFKYSFKNIGAGISGVHESPEKPDFDKNWTYADYNPSNLISPFLEFRAVGFKLHLAYLSVSGGEFRAVGDKAQRIEIFLPERYPFRNAEQASLSYRFALKKFQALTLTTRYLQGEKSEFALWTTSANYQMEEHWAFSFQSQMVAVQDNLEGRQTALWSFANNDSVSLGVNYVF